MVKQSSPFEDFSESTWPMLSLDDVYGPYQGQAAATAKKKQTPGNFQTWYPGGSAGSNVFNIMGGQQLQGWQQFPQQLSSAMGQMGTGLQAAMTNWANRQQQEREWAQKLQQQQQSWEAQQRMMGLQEKELEARIGLSREALGGRNAFLQAMLGTMGNLGNIFGGRGGGPIQGNPADPTANALYNRIVGGAAAGANAPPVPGAMQFGNWGGGTVGQSPAAGTGIGSPPDSIWGPQHAAAAAGRLSGLAQQTAPAMAGVEGGQDYMDFLRAAGARSMSDLGRAGGPAQQQFDLTQAGANIEGRDRIMEILLQLYGQQLDPQQLQRERDLQMMLYSQR